MAYLRQNCVLKNTSNDSIRDQWQVARARVKAPMMKAGQPEVLDFPAGYETYLTKVQANPAFEETVTGMNWAFKLVEIDPLIAFQFHIQLERSANLCRNVADAEPRVDDMLEPLVDDMVGPVVDDMLGVCLPLDVEDIPASVVVSGSSLTVEAESTNLKFIPVSGLGVPEMREITIPVPRRVRTVGMHFLPSSPLLHVVRHKGRTYLKNGYHRAYGFGKAGASHIPCIYLEGETDFTAMGIVAGRTFQPDLLESGAPPTVGHFVQERAYPVSLKATRQALRINWSWQIRPN